MPLNLFNTLFAPEEEATVAMPAQDTGSSPGFAPGPFTRALQTAGEGQLSFPPGPFTRALGVQQEREPAQPERTAFGAGISAGLLQTKALGHAASGVLGDLIGADEFAQERMADYERLIQEAQSIEGGVDNLDEALESPAKFLSYSARVLGEQVPTIASILLTGGIGGITARLAAHGAVKLGSGRLIQKQLAEKILTGKTGFGAGAFAGTTALESGGIYGEQHDEGLEMRPGVALAFGAAGGALELVPWLGVAGLFGRGPLARKYFTDVMSSAGVLKRIGIGGATISLSEASTEALQELNALAARRFVDEQFDMLGPEARDRILESAVAGGIVGTVFGGFGGAVARPDRLLGDTTRPDTGTIDRRPPPGPVLDDPPPDGPTSEVSGVDTTTAEVLRPLAPSDLPDFAPEPPRAGGALVEQVVAPGQVLEGEVLPAQQQQAAEPAAQNVAIVEGQAVTLPDYVAQEPYETLNAVRQDPGVLGDLTRMLERIQNNPLDVQANPERFWGGVFNVLLNRAEEVNDPIRLTDQFMEPIGGPLYDDLQNARTLEVELALEMGIPEQTERASASRWIAQHLVDNAVGMTTDADAFDRITADLRRSGIESSEAETIAARLMGAEEVLAQAAPVNITPAMVDRAAVEAGFFMTPDEMDRMEQLRLPNEFEEMSHDVSGLPPDGREFWGREDYSDMQAAINEVYGGADQAPVITSPHRESLIRALGLVRQDIVQQKLPYEGWQQLMEKFEDMGYAIRPAKVETPYYKRVPKTGQATPEKLIKIFEESGDGEKGILATVFRNLGVDPQLQLDDEVVGLEEFHKEWAKHVPSLALVRQGEIDGHTGLMTAGYTPVGSDSGLSLAVVEEDAADAMLYDFRQNSEVWVWRNPFVSFSHSHAPGVIGNFMHTRISFLQQRPIIMELQADYNIYKAGKKWEFNTLAEEAFRTKVELEALVEDKAKAEADMLALEDQVTFDAQGTTLGDPQVVEAYLAAEKSFFNLSRAEKQLQQTATSQRDRLAELGQGYRFKELFADKNMGQWNFQETIRALKQMGFDSVEFPAPEVIALAELWFDNYGFIKLSEMNQLKQQMKREQSALSEDAHRERSEVEQEYKDQWVESMLGFFPEVIQAATPEAVEHWKKRAKEWRKQAKKWAAATWRNFDMKAAIRLSEIANEAIGLRKLIQKEPELIKYEGEALRLIYKHMTVEPIVNQYRETYAWIKRNFDTEEVRFGEGFQENLKKLVIKIPDAYKDPEHPIPLFRSTVPGPNGGVNPRFDAASQRYIADIDESIGDVC